MWTVEYILSQVCVVLALSFLIGSYYLKNRVWILIFSLGNAVFYSLEFMFLGAYTGAIINLIAILRGIWFYFLQKNNKEYDWISILVLSILMIVAGVFTFDSWYSVFPIIGTLIYTISIWQKNVKVYRWLSLPVGASGVVYNIMCKSVLGIVSELALFVFGLVSIIIYYLQQKPKQNEIIQNEEQEATA